MKKPDFKQFAVSYSLSNGGGFMLIQATVASYFTLFLTDTFGIPAGITSILMFAVTLFDAVKDPFIGAAVDRTNTRFGRYRPYFLIFPFLYMIFSILLFLNPKGLDVTQKLVYTAVFYTLYGFALSFCTTAAQAVLPAQTTDNQERNFAVMLSTTCVAVSFTIASSFTTNFVDVLGGYAPLMLLYGLLGMVSFWMLYRCSTEQFLQPVTKRPVSMDLKIILGHRELYGVLVVWCMGSLGYGVMFSASTYYILYYIARPELISVYMLTLSIGALVSMTIGLPFAMRLCRTAQKALIVTQAMAAVCYAVLMLSGKNLPLLFVLSFIAAAVSSMQQGLLGILLNDVIDYIQLKDGLSLNGTLSAVKGFAYKFGSAFTSTIILAVLSLTGYEAGNIGGQSHAVTSAINALRFIVPILSAVILILCLLRYPIEKYYPQIAEMKEKMKEDIPI